tara:strand:+ start:1148 stop:2653 length:1506 start_codon:yes stop_codon:yes gene_type:complete
MSKYTSLHDIYTENTLGKKVAPLRERVQVFFKAESDQQPKVVGAIDDETAAKLKRKILNSSEGTVKILNDILEKCDWKGTNEKEYIQKILGPVNEAVENTSDVNNKELKEFASQKKTKTLFLETMINAAENETTFSIIDPLEDAVKTVFSSPHETVQDICLINPTLNNVGVGKGEIAITMFSNAVKGDVGDLLFPGFGDVELKGLSGRPGKTGNAFAALKTLPKMLKDLKGHDVFTGSEIREKYKHLAKNRNELSSYLNNVIQSVDKKFEEGTSDGIREVLDFVEEIDNDSEVKLKDANDLEFQLKNDLVRVLPKIIDKRSYNAVINRVSKYFNSLRDYINANENKVVGASKDSESSTTDPAIKNFFLNEWGLSKEEIIDGFLELASEARFDKKQFKEGLDQILDLDTMRSLARRRDDNLLRAIVGALQISMYKEHEGFKIILFMNDNTMNGFPLMPQGDSVKDRFVYTFNVVKRLVDENKLAIGLSIDSRSKGVAIKLNV